MADNKLTTTTNPCGEIFLNPTSVDKSGAIFDPGTTTLTYGPTPTVTTTRWAVADKPMPVLVDVIVIQKVSYLTRDELDTAIVKASATLAMTLARDIRKGAITGYSINIHQQLSLFDDTCEIVGEVFKSG